MKKEEITVVAQLLTAMKDSVEKIDEAQRNKDSEQLLRAKRELLTFQKRLEELL